MFESLEKDQGKSGKKPKEEKEEPKEDQKESVEPKELTEQEINYIDRKTDIGCGKYSENIYEKLTTAEARDFFEYNLRKDILTTAWAKANGREGREVERKKREYEEEGIIEEEGIYVISGREKKDIISDTLDDMKAELEEKYSNIIEKVRVLEKEAIILSENEEEKKEREEIENKTLSLKRKFRKEFNDAMKSEEKQKEALEEY